MDPDPAAFYNADPDPAAFYNTDPDPALKNGTKLTYEEFSGVEKKYCAKVKKTDGACANLLEKVE